MFTWLNKQGVQSDKGYIVQRVARFEVEYRESKKKISIYVEPGYSAGKNCLIIRSDAFYKWDDGTSISEVKQKEILQNFKDANKFKGIDIEVWSP
jgi:hypothetical protein